MKTSQAKKLEDKAFNELVDGVQALYPEPLPRAEAEEAARNLTRFFELLVKAEQEDTLAAKSEGIGFQSRRGDNF